MRAAFAMLLVSLLVLGACYQRKKTLPPSTRFYFPSSIHHERTSPTGNGTLYVVSANFDRRYDTGLMTAVDLDAVGLPEFGATDGGGAPVQITDLKVTSDTQTIQIANFGGDLAAGHTASGALRMYIPSRAEGQKLMIVEANGTRLDCVAMTTSDGGSFTVTDPRDCGEVGATLVEFERSGDGVPRADSPLTAGLSRDGQTVWVTSGRNADSPRFSGMNPSDYIVRIAADALRVTRDDFIGLGPGSTHSLVAGQRWTYFSGRFPTGTTNPPLVRLVERNANNEAVVAFPVLETDVKLGDTRGIALSTNEDKLYLAGRQASGATGSDALIVATITNPTGDFPQVAFLRTVAVPTEPLMVKSISRGPTRGDLVVVVCGGGGALAIYDEETDYVVATVDGIGIQPSSFAIDRRGNGARIFITNFQDGRVAVVDMPNLDLPQNARLVAHLGEQQLCLTRNLQCDAGVPVR